MTFLAMSLALIVTFAWGTLSSFQKDKWFEQWRLQVASSNFAAPLKLLLIIGVPVVLLQWLLSALEPVLFGLVWILGAAYLMLYSMGRGDYAAQLERYGEQCLQNDFQAAYLDTVAQAGAADPDAQAAPLSVLRLHQQVLQQLLYSGYQRWFAVLFYFVVLGPAAGVAYRFIQLASEHDDNSAAQVLYWVDWLPSRLLAAAFALTGNFVESTDELLSIARAPSMPATQVLVAVALAATGADKQPVPEGSLFGEYAAQQTQTCSALLRRSGIFWVVIISLVVVFF